MLKSLLKVGGWTLLSRITGFARDILMAAFLGAGPMMDAFAVAFRLPNHFRAIFGEGAFSNAFVPAYTRIRTQDGASAGDLFHGRILTLLLIAQLVLLALALVFTSGLVGLLAPGFAAKGDIFDLTVELTRITFPYLLFVTLVTLWSGALNAIKHFSAAAAAPILLNVAMIATLLAAAAFKTPAHAAAWGVCLAGLLEAGLLIGAIIRAGIFAAPRAPKLDGNIRSFFRAFGPAVIGSAGVQIAMLADTIIVTFLPTGGASSLYYADRLYQLPVGVIGIAAGTVLLPEMSRLIAEGNPEAAHRAQNRAIGFTLLLAAPFVAAFVLIPDFLMAVLFGRGAFDAAAIDAAAAVLAAYAIGLPAVLLIRSAVASFTARGDTRTPLWASLTAIACNLALKLLLWKSMGAAGLALATAIGAWINLAILSVLAVRSQRAAPDRGLGYAGLTAVAGALAMAGVYSEAQNAVIYTGLIWGGRYGRELALLLLGTALLLAYALTVLVVSRILKVPLRRR